MGYRILLPHVVLLDEVYWKVQKMLTSGDPVETADAHVAELLTLEVGVVKELGFYSIRDLVESVRIERVKALDGDGHEEERVIALPEGLPEEALDGDEVADACDGSGDKPTGPAEGRIE